MSPDSVSRDYRTKYLEYERAGVREYWIIDRDIRRVEAYARGRNGKYQSIESDGDKIVSVAIPGLFLRTAWLLVTPMPSPLKCLRELGVA